MAPRLTPNGAGRPIAAPKRTLPTGQPQGARQAMAQSAATVAPQQAPPATQPTPTGGLDVEKMIEAAKGFNHGVTPLSAPTQNPNEPVTAGAPMGPGPGPEVLGIGNQSPPLLTFLQGLFLKYPLSTIRNLIDEATSAPKA